MCAGVCPSSRQHDAVRRGRPRRHRATLVVAASYRGAAAVACGGDARAARRRVVFGSPGASPLSTLLAVLGLLAALSSTPFAWHKHALCGGLFVWPKSRTEALAIVRKLRAAEALSELSGKECTDVFGCGALWGWCVRFRFHVCCVMLVESSL